MASLDFKLFLKKALVVWFLESIPCICSPSPSVPSGTDTGTTKQVPTDKEQLPLLLLLPGAKSQLVD